MAAKLSGPASRGRGLCPAGWGKGTARGTQYYKRILTRVGPSFAQRSDTSTDWLVPRLVERGVVPEGFCRSPFALSLLFSQRAQTKGAEIGGPEASRGPCGAPCAE